MISGKNLYGITSTSMGTIKRNKTDRKRSDGTFDVCSYANGFWDGIDGSFDDMLCTSGCRHTVRDRIHDGIDGSFDVMLYAS